MDQVNLDSCVTKLLDHYNVTPQPLLVKRSVPKNTTLAAAANAAWSASGLAGSFEPASKEYYLNNTLASGTTEITADSSVLIIPDLTVEAGKKDYIGYFDKSTATINVGGTVTLNLKGKTAIDAVSGDNIAYSYITVNGVAGFDYTNGDGNVSLTFLNAGTYIISAGNPKASAYGADSGDKISRPYCKVVVNPVSAHSAKVSVRVEGKTANLVYEPTLTVNSDGTKAITALDALKAATTDIDFSGGQLNRVKTDSAVWEPNGYSYSIFYNGVLAPVGLSDLAMHNGDELLIFFCVSNNDWTPITKHVSNLTAVKQDDGSYKLTFTNNYTPWGAPEPIVSPITGATVTWGYDSTTNTYTTDENGQVLIPAIQAAAGRHSLQIEKDDVNGAPTVVRLTPDYTINIAETVASVFTTKTLTDTTTPVDLVVPNDITTANIVASGAAGGTATLPAITVVNEQSTGSALSMEIAAGTVVTSYDNGWNGTIQVPTVTTASVTGQTVQKAISVGLAGQTLNFDKPVRLVIPGAANYKVGFLKTDGSLQEITTVLANDNINAATAALTGGINEAKIAVGADMVVWTKHFTSFVAYTTPTSGGGTAQQVYISVKNPKGQTYLSKKSYTFETGMTALSLLQKTDLDIELSGNYVVAIEGLAEKSAGYPNSGWMYKVGSKFPTIATSSYKLEAGDYVQWLYSYDLGKDLGADYKEEDPKKPEENAQTGKAFFKDVAENHWAHDHIYYLANKGIIKGKTADTYAPGSNITRAEFVTVLARMSGADLTKYTAASYLDVKNNAWYISAVAWATKVGVAGGTDGKFNPNANISREEMAAMISRYAAKIAKYTLPETNPVANFADNTEISFFAKDAVIAMQKAGIINGVGENKFAPKNSATRGEAAKMLAVLLRDIEKAAK
ncbi:MAG: S-layer homology domain-containing protein [Clostridia bacterium]|nr:S-layer homology domain-containing protein [Clostridia bacterium]